VAAQTSMSSSKHNHAPAKKPVLYYTDHYGISLPSEHKFPIPKYKKLRERLTQESIFEFVPAEFASAKDLERTHHAGYIRKFIAGELSEQEMRRIGFPWSQGLVERSLASVGGTLAATEDAIKHGWGGSLAGGTHHAYHAEGSGFCVFNDIAVAIHKLFAQGRVERAAVVDLDVHQGDGTAQIFAGEQNVFTLSLHGKNNFPFRKQNSRLDVELTDGTGDEEYLSALDRILPDILAFRPRIIFYQSGVDALESDSLGRLSLTAQGMKDRDRRVFTAVIANKIPLVITLGGGYSKPIELTVEAHASTYLLAAEMFGRK